MSLTLTWRIGYPYRRGNRGHEGQKGLYGLLFLVMRAIGDRKIRLWFFLFASLFIHASAFLFLSHSGKKKALAPVALEVKLVELPTFSDPQQGSLKARKSSIATPPQVRGTNPNPLLVLKKARPSLGEFLESPQTSEGVKYWELEETLADDPLTEKKEHTESLISDSVALSSKTGDLHQSTEEERLLFVYEESEVSQRPYFKTLVKPKYPEIARKMGKEGLVVLRVLVDENGRVKEVQVLRSAGFGFDEEAKKAIRQSLFEPAKHHGKPVPCYVRVPVRFVLEEN